MEILKGIGTFLQDQVLGMKWLNEVIGNMLSLFGLDVTSRIGGSVLFFLYDVTKITILLCFLIFLISYIQSYFPPERSKKIMARFHGVWANIIAALLGTVTPFCSCSSIPLFIGFTSAGLPLGVTFSFLISSPMVDLGSLVLLMSIFGWQVAVLYVILGLVIAVVGGTLIEKLHMEKYVEDFIKNASSVDIENTALTQKDRLYLQKTKLFPHSKKSSHISLWVLVSAQLFITGFQSLGLKWFSALTILLVLSLPHYLEFLCMLIFSAQFLLLKHYYSRAHSLEQYYHL